MNEVQVRGRDDDRLVALAELYLANVESDPRRAAAYLRWVNSLADSCEPQTVEFVALRIAPHDMRASLQLVRRIPMPNRFLSFDGVEYPHRARCVYRIFGELARKDPEQAISQSAALEHTSDLLHASVAVASVLILHSPETARTVLDHLFSKLDGEVADQCRQIVGRYLYFQIQDLPIKRFLPAFHVIERFSHEYFLTRGFANSSCTR